MTLVLRRALLGLLCLACITPYAAAQRSASEFRDDGEFSAEAAAAVDSRILKQREKDGAVGIAIGVIRDGEIVYLRGYGSSDAKGASPITLKTMFRWASVSKPLTAVAAMQLHEAGKLDLEADIRQYVPSFPDHGARITARDLLCHQGGIVHYRNGRVVKTKRQYDTPHPFADVVAALDTFQESPLLFTPGERFSYTTHGYILLSAVVQQAGGQKFHQQVAERIAEPCGMTSLQPDYQWVDIPNRVQGHRKFFGQVVASDDSDVSWKLGGGGYISNIEDMARFARGLIHGKLISSESEKRMWTRQPTSSGKPTGYGLGFSCEGTGADLRVSHSGAQPKTRTYLVFWPRRKTGLVVATNSEWVSPRTYVQQITPLVHQTAATGSP